MIPLILCHLQRNNPVNVEERCIKRTSHLFAYTALYSWRMMNQTKLIAQNPISFFFSQSLIYSVTINFELSILVHFYMQSVTRRKVWKMYLVFGVLLNTYSSRTKPYGCWRLELFHNIKNYTIFGQNRDQIVYLPKSSTRGNKQTSN